MNTKVDRPILFFNLLAVVFLFSIAACSPSVGTADFAAAAAPEESQDAVRYERFSLPEGVSFELPEGWQFWANAGYLSPDDGQTTAGLRFSWIEEGKDAEVLLYNEGAVVHEKITQVVSGIETHRYIVEVTLTSAATGETIHHAYEMIYAFPAPNGEMMTGVVVSAPTLEALQPLVPVAEHMLASLTWD